MCSEDRIASRSAGGRLRQLFLETVRSEYMNGYHRIKDTALIGFVTLVLSAAPVLAADSTDTAAQHHDAAAAAHEKTARHHRAAAQHHRVGEHTIAKAHAKEAERTSADAHDRTRTATNSSHEFEHHTSLSKDGR